jgi:hypothetical protein
MENANFVTVSEVTILRRYPFSPEFLFSYLLTAHGQAQIQRQISGATGQQHLLKSKAEKVVIPAPPAKLEQQIRETVVEAALLATRAKDAYTAAEQTLNSAIGLDHVDLTPRLFYEARFASASAAARLDAEYLSPRMQNLIAALSRDCRTVADVASLVKRRFRPKSEQAFGYIEIGDLTPNGTAEANFIPGGEAPSRAQWVVKPGDIITSTVRPIRRLSALVLPEQSDFVCSSGFAVLQPKHVEPELLVTYLRLPLVCELLDLQTTASMYPALSTADLLRIPVNLPGEADRKTIAREVRRSIAARRQSTRLVDAAKHAVEVITEQGEEAALQVLKQVLA